MQSSPSVRIKIHPGSTLVLLLLLDTQIAEPLLFRPTLDDWLVDNGEVIFLPSSIEPPYLYLNKNRFTQKIILSIPLNWHGQILKSWLRFPAIQEEAISIHLEILSPEQGKNKHHVEVALPVTLPFTAQKSLPSGVDKTTAGCFGLISGVMDLDKIPSRWLAAELLAILCQKGEEYAQTESGRQLLDRLNTTSLFQNGAYAFASAQISSWIVDSLKSTNIILGGHSLLNVWQQWLLSLVPVDRSLPKTFVPERSASRWFAGIVLGLAQISPKIAIKLKEIASGEVFLLTCSNFNQLEAEPPRNRSQVEPGNDLIAALGSLNTIPARWLVVELLLLVCIQGKEYAQSQAGSELLFRLKQSNFFHNGVLAFDAALLPRWLTITQQAASAYHTSVGTLSGQGGLLVLGEQWLWSLMPTDLNDSKISVLGAAADAFVASMDMDAERWFSCVVLGLVVLSPTIADIVRAIASSPRTTPLLSPTPSRQILDDILTEGGSLQR